MTAIDAPSRAGQHWWWHAPRNRCLGYREQHPVRHTGVRLAVAIAVVSVVVTVIAVDRAGIGFRIPIGSALAIVYAGNAVAVTIPVAGTAASAAFTYRQYVQRGASGPMAGWAMAMAGVFSTTAFAALIGIGALANGNPVAMVAGLVSIVIAIAPVAAVIIAVRNPALRAHIERPVVAALRLSKRIVHRPRFEPSDVVANAITQLSSYRINRRQGAAATLFAVTNWALDAMCLWAVLQVFDVSMPFRNLSLLYAATVAAASLGFTPAGIGTVESAIAVTLAHLGTDGAHALLAAVVYRAISTWLVLLVGWAVLVALRRSTAPIAATKGVHRIETDPVPHLALASSLRAKDVHEARRAPSELAAVHHPPAA